MTNHFLLAVLTSVLAGGSPAPASPGQPGERLRLELRPGENYFRADGRPVFVLGRNPAGMNPKAYDDHFRHAAVAV